MKKKPIKKLLVFAINFASRSEFIKKAYLWGLKFFPSLANRLQQLIITDEIARNIKVNFFNRGTSQEWCQENNLIYFFVDHLVEITNKKGLQRVSRMLSSSLLAQGKKIRFVKWDERICSLVYMNSADLELLRKRIGPTLTPKEAAFYSNVMMAGVEVPLHKGQDNWLIVPEIPYLTNYTGLKPVHIIKAARLLGLKTAFILYDAISVPGPEMPDAAFKHNEYIRQLGDADVVLPISDCSNSCLMDALTRRNNKGSVHSPILVSIIIPVYNNVELTRHCIESILSQRIVANYEIIVVDDASTDNTPEYLKSLGDRVRVVRNSENLRFAGACNAGARIAHGNYLLFLNNDTIPEKGWLDAMLSMIISDQRIGVVGAKLIYPDRTIQHCGIVFKSDISGFLTVHRLRNTHENDSQVTYPMQFSAVTGACMLVRGDIFSRLSGFNESFGMYFEDIDFCLSVQKIGYIIVYEPLASVVHFERGSFSNKIKSLMRQSFIIFNYKWKDTIKLLGPLREGIPYSRVSENSCSASDKSPKTLLGNAPMPSINLFKETI